MFLDDDTVPLHASNQVAMFRCFVQRCVKFCMSRWGNGRTEHRERVRPEGCNEGDHSSAHTHLASPPSFPSFRSFCCRRPRRLTSFSVFPKRFLVLRRMITENRVFCQSPPDAYFRFLGHWETLRLGVKVTKVIDQVCLGQILKGFEEVSDGWKLRAEG